MIFLTGIVKILFSALAIAVMFAMIGSYFAAMTVMPFFASRFLRPLSVAKLPRFFIWTHQLIHQLTEFYGKMLNRAFIIGNQFLLGALVYLFLEYC